MTGEKNAIPRNLGNILSLHHNDDRIVLIDLRDSRTFSGDEFKLCIQGIARGLRNLGIEPGHRVGFLSANRWEMLAGYLGTAYMGAVAVPINFKFPKKTIEHIAYETKLSVMFVDERRRELAPEKCRCIDFDDDGQEGFESILDPGPIDVFEPNDNHLVEILYTSGSTGLPNGVPLTHSGQLWALSKYVDQNGPSAVSERSLIVAPLYHMNALFHSCVCLLGGTTIVSLPRFDAASYISAAAEYRCTHLSGVPTMFALVAALAPENRPADLCFVKSIILGSAPLPASLLDQVSSIFPAAQIANGYGTTEAGPAIFGPHPDGKATPPLSIGYPFDDVHWRLTGEGSPNEGVLELRTKALAKGYLNRPHVEADRYQGGWFRTNDVMRRDEDGFFYFVSRADDMFVCGGENIYPGEVEAVINRHAAIQQSVVVSAPDDVKGMVPVAYVVPSANAQIDEAEIKKFCIENGPVYAHPRRVIVKRVLPVGGTHKIDRRLLEREAAELMVLCGRSVGA